MQRTPHVAGGALLLIAAMLATTMISPVAVSATAPPNAPAADGSDDHKEPRSATVGTTDRFVVEFATKADLSGARTMSTREERGAYVSQQMKDHAGRSQREVLQLVDGTPGATATGYWLRNVVIVEGGDEALRARIEQVEGVRTTRPERVYQRVEPVEIVADEGGAELPYGVRTVRADEAWGLGVTGAGVVVANIDTGVDLHHPALVDSYRGATGDGAFVHDYNWWDPTGICGAEPCDNAGHGTHVMGTMVGGDGPGPFAPDIGVAPGASWIAAKGCENFGCSESSLLSSGQFVLAPTDLDGQNPDPSRAPHIVNNSWGGGPGDPFYEDIVTAWREAGIVPVFAAGNAGPGCGTGGSPGDYAGSFSVGATDETDRIAFFSSRGPSVFGKTNPDVTAPGVNVLSAVPGGGYESYSGTSMAAPHAAGVLALVMSAGPGLTGEVDAATALLEDTALGIVDHECGGHETGIPNNTYGAGRIDALEAVTLVAEGGTLAGAVTDEAGQPVAGARITATSDERRATARTDASGAFELFLPAGTYAVAADAFGYLGDTVSAVEIVKDTTTTVQLSLAVAPTATISGTAVSAEHGGPLAAVTISVPGTPLAPVTTSKKGAFSLRVPYGTYTLRAAAGGCLDRDEVQLAVSADTTVQLRMARRLDRFGYGCGDTNKTEWVDARTPSGIYGDESYGRLELPFGFPFYGNTYDEVYVSTNGFVSFTDPFWSNFFVTPIPDAFEPNAAIYPLWTDLVVDQDSRIDYDAKDDRFIIEWVDVRPFGGRDRASFEVELHRDGTVRFRYDARIEALGAGSRSTIGIEDEDGQDALQIGYREALAAPNSTIEVKVVATRRVRGTVTDRNDGQPIAGASVVAEPGRRTATTAADGTYRLAVIDGSYTVQASAPNWVTASTNATVGTGTPSAVADLSLASPIAALGATEVRASGEVGETVERAVTLSNPGTAPLTYTVRERDLGGTPPTLPPASIEGRRQATEWRRGAVPAGARERASAYARPAELDLDVVIEDPDDDADGQVEITALRGGADGGVLSLELVGASADALRELGGWLHLDVDRDPSTGVPPEFWYGLPSHDIGADYVLDLFFAGSVEHDPVVLVLGAETGEFIDVVPASHDGAAVRFDIPWPLIGEHDGFVDLTGVVGDWERPQDWLPNDGHGTVQPWRDAPWLSIAPDAGVLAPGEAVTLTLAMTSEDAGLHEALVRVATNAARVPDVHVDVSYDVALPASWGSASGTVTDARTGAPVDGARVRVETSGPDGPATREAVTGQDGRYRLFAPAGTWPIDVTSPDHASVSGEVTVSAAADTVHDVALTPLDPDIAVTPTELYLVIEEGGFADATLEVTNAGGGALYVEAAPDAGWLWPDPWSAEVASGETLSMWLWVDGWDMHAGETHTATLWLWSNDPDQPEIAVTVTVDVVAPGGHTP